MFPNAGTQTVRFRRPITESSAAADASEKLKTGGGKKVIKGTLIREQLNRVNPPWVPKLSVAFRIIVLVRFCGAMYTAISDCDETFNYWEPTHYLIHGSGFQTWEYSPRFAIRSWAYILLHVFPAWIASKVFTLDKRPGFFAIRAAFAFISSYCEARLYRSIADHVNIRAARYFLAFTMFSAGMWNASTAFLPSSFALHAITLAYSYIIEPASSSSTAYRRTFSAILCLATAVLVGWPFVGALAIPFVIEEVSMAGDDEVMPASRPIWAMRRVQRVMSSGLTALALIGIPVFLIDTLAYGHSVFVPLKIILYNVFPSAGSGPELYGTEPWYYYFLNLALNFNIVFPLALASLPLLYITANFSTSAPVRLGTGLRHAQQSSAARLLLVRLAPVYLWLSILSQQAHKEERFMYPIYTLISVNAAVTLSLMRGWLEDTFIKITSSPYRAGRTSLFGHFTRSILAIAIAISASRMLAIQRYYHAPFDLLFHFQYNELPVRAIQTYPEAFANLKLNNSLPILEALEYAEETVDLGILAQEHLRLCVGSEWYRFPTSFLVPNEVEVRFIEGGFRGQLPGRFVDAKEVLRKAKNTVGGVKFEDRWPWMGTRMEGSAFNSLNKPENDRLVKLETCSYLITVEYPHRAPEEQVNKVDEDEWDRRACWPILDSERSSRWTRVLWFPLVEAFGDEGSGTNKFGELCLRKKKA
ncbi:hypothetical protein CROQUDRAFT_668606 [Cronartium quercuum f. sp. fusiforme G11]|uniref:Mannosyltransferase n=1 Tax=Cronartium quercuum f. sp. fusiforme G11 TaxID=708437 RepID=A0A9P6NN97_9BASI|nr:hypothetical protein CROQUDRAFT_668606 [Cronartium quercuum f. sp. fusiforme G11]